jgi:hypothetical protein
MAVASWLAEADAINFPARAPGVPAWPDSLHLSVQIRAIRGSKLIESHASIPTWHF